MRGEPFDIIEGDWTVKTPVYDAPTGWEPTALPQGTAAVPEPIEYYPTDPYAPTPGDEVLTVYQPTTMAYDPQPIDEVYPILKTMSDPPCNCIMAPCDCDGSQPMPYEPVPMVQVSEPPPVVDLPTVVNTQPTTTQTPITAVDGEKMKILGLPWYYVVGIGVAGLFILSSTDGKN